MRRSRLIAGLTRNIFLLGLVSLFTDLSSQMLFPLIPLFMTSVLGTGASLVGIVEGAAETTASLLKVFSGYWSDRISSRKPFLVFGYSLSSVTKPLFAFARTWPFVLAARVVERIGKGLRTAPRDALVAESCDEGSRGKAYGYQRAMDGVGSIAGAAVAFILFPSLGYRKIFLFSFVPGLIAVLVLLLVRERRNPVTTSPVKPSFTKMAGAIPRNLRLFIAASSIFALGHFGYAFILLRAKNIGLADEKAILFYLLFYVVYTVCIIPSGVVSDRIGRKPVLAAGYLLFAATSVGLIFVEGPAGILLLFALYGIFFSMIDGVQRAFVVDLAPGGMKATALGVFHTAVGIAALPGGFAAGVLWDRISPETTFVYGAVMALLSLILLLFVRGHAAGTGLGADDRKRPL